MNQRSVHFRIVLKGPRSRLKQSVVRKVRGTLAASGPVGRLGIEPYEKHGERNTVLWGTLTSSAPLERIVMRLAHGWWQFRIRPDEREALWDVRGKRNDRDDAVVPELLWAHVQRYRDSRAYPFVGPVDGGTKRPVPWSKRPRSIRRLWPKLDVWSPRVARRWRLGRRFVRPRHLPKRKPSTTGLRLDVEDASGPLLLRVRNPTRPRGDRLQARRERQGCGSPDAGCGDGASPWQAEVAVSR
jgi:hypothetical protein